MKTMTAVRLLGAAALIIALAATTYVPVRDGVFVLWNFFGFFTIQSNVIGIVVLLLAVRFTGLERPRWVELARACATVYLVIVGIVYWTLLVGVDVQIAYPWANVVLHGVSSVLLLADWLIEGPRAPLPWRSAWVVLIYPVVWLIVVIVRGATDGWVPYPFLDPSHGYVSVAIVGLGIAVVGYGLGLAVFRLTRWRFVIPA